MLNQMQLFKNLAGSLVLLSLCSCGGSETVPAGAGGAAPRPVVKYSRSGDAAVRKAVAEEALKQKGAGGAAAPAPSRKAPAEAQKNTVSQLPAKPSREPQAGPAPKPAAARPAPAEPRGASAAKPALRGKAPAEAAELLLRRLAGPPALARKAYVELWGVGKEQIPELIRQVDSKQLTRLIELDLLVLQKGFARYDEKEKRWYYWIKGMGNFEIDDIAMSKIPGRKGSVRVRMKKFGGFPLGVVVRAGLLNRFRSTRFPGVDDRKNLSRWWKLFYQQNASALK